MAIALPKKSSVAARVAEEARRKDVNASNVPQEALDCYEELIAAGKSPREAFTEYGYSLRIVDAARGDQDRIVRELKVKPSAEIEGGTLVVADVMTKNSIEEFVPKVIDEPVVEK
jgi:hypothetical protein